MGIKGEDCNSEDMEEINVEGSSFEKKIAMFGVSVPLRKYLMVCQQDVEVVIRI